MDLVCWTLFGETLDRGPSGRLDQVHPLGFLPVAALWLRGVIVAVSLLGLLAMHGLSADHLMPMPALHAADGYSAQSTELLASPGLCSPRELSSGVVDIGMTKHSQCLATLPPGTPQLGAPAMCAWQASCEQRATLAASAIDFGRGPPEMPLTRSCVSRT